MNRTRSIRVGGKKSKGGWGCDGKERTPGCKMLQPAAKFFAEACTDVMMRPVPLLIIFADAGHPLCNK